VYVGLTVLLGQGTIPVREPNVFATVVVTRIVLSKTVTLPTVAVVIDPAIAVVIVAVLIAVDGVSVSVTVGTADVLVGADALLAADRNVSVAVASAVVLADADELAGEADVSGVVAITVAEKAVSVDEDDCL
jgi:hypothetical protein